jgi:DNA-binding CsgD family transcriptional regulator
VEAGLTIELLEAVYRVQLDETEWLSGIVAAAAPLVDCARGMGALTYDARTPDSFRLDKLVLASTTPRRLDRDAFATALSSTWTASRCARLLRRGDCALVSEAEPSPALTELLVALAACKIADVFCVNSLETCGRGVLLFFFLPQIGVLSPRLRQDGARLARNLTAAQRLCTRRAAMPSARSLQPKMTEASLEQALHEPEVQCNAPAAGPSRPPNVSLREAGPSPTRLESLTPREHEVVALARLRHPNKIIADELGISVSTAGVLLARSLKKLGLHGRQSLFAAFDDADPRAQCAPK